MKDKYTEMFESMLEESFTKEVISYDNENRFSELERLAIKTIKDMTNGLKKASKTIKDMRREFDRIDVDKNPSRQESTIQIFQNYLRQLVDINDKL